MRLVDLESVHQRDRVVTRDVLAVTGAIGGHVGGRIAALAVGDAAMGPREMPHLRLPGAVVAGIFMHEDHRRAVAGLFVIQPSAIPRSDMRHLVLRLTEANYLHANETRVKFWASNYDRMIALAASPTASTDISVPRKQTMRHGQPSRPS